MIARGIPTELLALARATVDRVAIDLHRGGAYAQLIASRLYEALQLELSRTPSTEPAKRGLLAAAIEECRRSAQSTRHAPLQLGPLRTVVAMLETGSCPRPAVHPDARWRFTVIQGGLSKIA